MMITFLAAQAAAAEGENIKKYMSNLFSTQNTELSMITSAHISKDKPEYRSEFLALGLPLNSDFYQLLVTDGKYDFRLSQLQIVPIFNPNFGIGVTGQHIAGSDFESIQQYGFVGRMQGDIAGGFAQADFRWFPNEKIAETYAFIDGKKIFADLIGSYDNNVKVTSFTGGADYKINKNISLGLEAKFEHASNDLKRKIGIRGKYAF